MGALGGFDLGEGDGEGIDGEGAGGDFVDEGGEFGEESSGGDGALTAAEDVEVGGAERR